MRYIRSTYVPDGEKCYCLFEGSSREAVEEVQRRAEASKNTLKVQRLAGLYLIHLLKYRLYEVCNRQVPTVDDLTLVAQRLSPRYGVLLPSADHTLLEETLRTSFKLSQPDVVVSGATFTVSGLAILGLLLDDSSQLDALRAERRADPGRRRM